MKRATIAATQLVLALFPFSVLAEHHSSNCFQNAGSCCQTNELPGQCRRCPDQFAFSLWANYCNEKKSCFRRPRGHCHDCLINVDGCGNGACHSEHAHAAEADLQHYPDPSVQVPAEAAPMTPVPESKDGEVSLPDDESDNSTDAGNVDAAPDLPEIPDALSPDEIRDELDKAPAEPLNELKADPESEDRSAWRKPAWLRFRSRFGL